MKKTLLGSAAAALLCLNMLPSAQADVVLPVSMTYLSGAQFTGMVTFADDYSSVNAVSGVLHGYQFGTTGYVGTGSTAITWVWDGGIDVAPDGNVYATWLMDGISEDDYWNWIGFAYELNGSVPVLVAAELHEGSPYNNVSYMDPMTVGAVAVPEPASLALLGAGLLGFAAVRRRRTVTA